MIAIDTSVVVALFAEWHEAHDEVVGIMSEEPRIPVRVAIETYAVLTRLPVPHRVPASIVVEFLDRLFPSPSRLLLEPGLVRDAPARCHGAGIDGGATYDALIALTAVTHDAVLVSRDHRAARTYHALGARIRLIG